MPDDSIPWGLTIIYTQIVYTMRMTKTWEVAGKTLGRIRRKMTGKIYQSPKPGKWLEKLWEEGRKCDSQNER